MKFQECGSEFLYLISQSGYDREKIQKLFKVTDRTVSNWIRYGPPPYVTERLSMAAGTHPDWRGFKIREGVIFCANQDTVTKEEIELYQWTRRHLYLASKRNTELEKAAANVVKLGQSSNIARETNFQSLERLLRA